MEDLKFCKLCLAMELKMYSLATPALFEAYTQLLPWKPVPTQYVCYMCARLLQNYKAFYSQCSIAHSLLSIISLDCHKVAIETIKHVKQKSFGLKSMLTRSPIITYSDQFQLSKYSTDTEGTFFLDDFKSEIDSEVNNQYICNDLQNNESNLSDENIEANEINSFALDNDQSGSEYASKKKKKINAGMMRKNKGNESKKKKESTEINVKVEHIKYDETFCDLDDMPLSKILPKKSDLDVGISNKFLKRIITTNTEQKIKEHVKKKSGPKFNASYFEDYATVVLLSPDEAKKEVLLRKESSNYKNCPFKCDLCYRGYEAKVTFENHMKKHSSDFGMWDCEYCHLRFPEQKHLYKHQFSCHKRKFYCKICPYTCFCTHQAKTHISLHKGKKYPCKECGEVFSMPNSLLMHKRVKHLTECVCELCGSTFATQRGLFCHKKLLHRQEKNNENGPKCDECRIQFATEKAWKRHLVLSSKHKVRVIRKELWSLLPEYGMDGHLLRALMSLYDGSKACVRVEGDISPWFDIHAGIKQGNGCEFCGETFTGDDALKIHLKVHSRKQMNRGDNVKLPAACTVCEKWLTSRDEYKSHMTSLHPLSEAAKRIDAKDQIQCVCEVCGKVFKKQCFLLYHQRKHTGERPYQCRECGKSYAFPGALSTHKATHSRTRVHQCDMCHKVFTFKSALNKHVKAHLGIRPHKCSICDKSFPNPCDVKLHMKYVHYKVPWPKRDRHKRAETS